MYLRVFIFLFIFNNTIAVMSIPYLALFLFVSIITGLVIYKLKGGVSTAAHIESKGQANPLEFTMALFFMLFYSLFSFLSHYAEKHYGSGGIHLLSFLAGFADVDSFILNIIQGKFAMSLTFIVVAILLATTANNLIKLFYSMYFSEKKCKRLLIFGYGVIIIFNIVGILIAISTAP
jgi:uncharacterized membrane protein (DUF4010 family)